MTRTIGIDPGLTGTGLALLEGRSVTDVVTLRPKGRTWEIKCRWLSENVADILGQDEWDAANATIVIECPMLFQGAFGRGVAASGDLIKLTFAAGVCAAAAWGVSETVLLPTPNLWKGQLPKAVCRKRIGRVIDVDAAHMAGASEHAWDAVGLALWQMGEF